MVLYVTESGTQLHRTGQQIVVRKGGMELGRAHLHELEQVALVGRIGMTPDTMSALLRRGIDTVLLSATGEYRGRLIGKLSGNVALRQMQFRRHEDAAFRLHVAKALVAGKLRNQRSLMLRLARRRRLSVREPAARLRHALHSVGEATNLETLRGLEGAGSSAYFTALRFFLPEALGFHGRNRRPPRDPANALLSFAYALVTSQVEGAVYQAGLDPGVGFLHVTEYNRPSMVLDLMEEFRTVLGDTVVLDLANHHRLQADHWERRDGGVYLTESGRRLLIGRFRARMLERVSYEVGGGRVERITYGECLVRQARRMAAAIQDADTSYEPFRSR